VVRFTRPLLLKAQGLRSSNPPRKDLNTPFARFLAGLRLIAGRRIKLLTVVSPPRVLGSYLIDSAEYAEYGPLA